MRFFLRKYFIITVSIFVLKEIIPAIGTPSLWKDFFYASFLLALLFLIFRPIANLIALPINLLTLNLFSWIINILVFYLWTLLQPAIKINNWQIPSIAIGPLAFQSLTLQSFQVLVVAAILLTVIIQFFNWLIK